MIDRTTISAIAAELGVSWHTVSAIAMRATADLIAAAGPDRLSGVRMIGVDEHRWAPRRFGPDGFVTLIIDLTPTYDQTGPARLLDMVAGRSATALASWLAAQPAEFAQAVEVVAMDGFAGYKTAATAVVPDAVTVMDPFHVVALAAAKLDLIRPVVPHVHQKRRCRRQFQCAATRRRPGLAHLRLDYDEKQRWIVMHRGRLAIACNLGAKATSVPISGEVVQGWGVPKLAVNGTVAYPISHPVTGGRLAGAGSASVVPP